MNTKRKILSIMLVLALTASAVVPQMQTAVWAAGEAAGSQQEFTFTDKSFYTKIKSALGNAVAEYDDNGQKLKVDTEKVTSILLNNANMTKGNSMEQFNSLIESCEKLSELRLSDCTLGDFDFSGLNDKTSLTTLYVVGSSLKQMPDLRLANLTTLCLSRNIALSADGACDALTKENFPKLDHLYMDRCSLTTVRFMKKLDLSNLTYLSLGDNKLNASVIDELVAMKESLSKLKVLNFGKYVKSATGTQWNASGDSMNKLTDAEWISFLNGFTGLQELDLRGCGITSLEGFQGYNGNTEVNLEENKISDFAGCERNDKLNLKNQGYKIPGEFVEGREYTIPEEMQGLIQKVFDETDGLYSTLDQKLKCGDSFYRICSISDDLKKITIDADIPLSRTEVLVTVRGGKISGSTFTGTLKHVPSYEIPQGLTAEVGDTLADVTLPAGFTWENSKLSLEKAGEYTYKAKYKPTSESYKYIEVSDIDIPVTVAGGVPTPSTPTPAEPTPTPEVPTPTPAASTPTPVPMPTPVQTPVPQMPTPTPQIQTPEPSASTVLTPTPYAPVSTMPVKTLSPATPTRKPDESKQSGNEIEERKDLSLLLATGKQKGKSGVRLTWRKWEGCSGYEVYWSFCDGKRNYKKLKTVSSTGKRVGDHKELKKDRAYKYYVATYEIKDGRKYYLAKSPTIHVAMNREPRTNAKSIKLNKGKVTLKNNQIFQIKAFVKKENKDKKLLEHEEKFRYYVDDRSVVDVSKKGRIRAKKKGVCTVFVIANNGVANKIKVTVKA